MIHRATNKELKEIASILKTEFEVNDFSSDELTSYLVFGELEGFLSFSNLYDHFDLNYIWVDPSFRKKGIASKLIEKMVSEAKKCGIHQIVLEVDETNENGLLLYKKMGFQIVSKRKNYYHGRDAFMMVLEIR